MIYLFNDVKELTGTVRNNHILNLLYEREKNGIYSVSAEIPVTYNDQGTIYNYNKKIQKSDFLGHYDREGRFQLHKIAAVDIENGSIFVKGIHIFFDEAKAGAIIQDRRFVNREIIDGARVAFESIGWSVSDFDVSVSKTYNFYNVTPLEARQILVETFGFEFDYWLDFDGKKVTNRHVAVKEKIGEKTNKRYTYGHNVLNIRAEQDYSEIYTAVIGRGKGEEIEETGGYGRRIEYTDVVWTTPSKPLNKPAGTRILEDPNATQLFGYKENGVVKPRIKVEVFSDIEDPTELIQASYDWLMDNNVPKAVFSLKVADGDGLNLGDEVYVIYRDIDLVKSARVEKVIDDLVSGNRDVEFGDTAYFDTDRRLSGMRADLKRYSGETGDRIYRLKMEFNRRFDEEVSSWVEEYEQALIDVHAEIEAAEQRHEDRWQEIDDDINRNIEKIVGGNVDILDTNLLDINQRMLSKLEESDLDPFENRLTVNEEGIDGLLTRTKKNETDIGTFQVTADRLSVDFANYKQDIDSDVGTLSAQVASYESSVDGFRAEVGTLQGDIDNVDSWIAQKGSIIDGNADAIRARVWNKDIDDLKIGGRNLLINSNADELSNVASWRVWQSDRTRVTVGGKIFAQARTTSASNFGLQPGYSSGDRFEIVEGRDYIISFEGYTSLTSGDFNYTYLMRADGGNQGSLVPYKVEDAPLPGASNNKRYYFKLTANWSSTEAYLLIGARTRPQWADTSEARWIRFRKPQIIEGTKEVPYSQAPENFLQHTDFILESDGFFLGGKYVGGDHYSTAIVGSANGVDILADEMRVTGDLLVKGDVESYAISAVRADFQSATANYFSANMINSKWLKVDTALFDRFTSSTAFINSLTAKNAFISNIKAIDITASRIISEANGSRTRIEGGFLESRGTHRRSWLGSTTTNQVDMRLENGYLRARNNTLGHSLYFSDFGISTYADATGDDDASGSLIFRDTSYSTASSLMAHSTYGVVSLQSEHNSIMLAPMNTSRRGNNIFRFAIKDNDSAGDTDGWLSFGSPSLNYATGIRFQKTTASTPTLWVTNGNGDIGTGNISVQDAEIRGHIRTADRLNFQQWNDRSKYNQIGVGAVNTYNSVVLASHSGGNAYIGVGSHQLRVTNNNGYNGGNTGWRDIEFRNWKANSHERYKEDIKEWNVNVLDIFKEELQLYQYKYTDDLENNMLHRGIVLREDSTEDKFPAEWRQDDGFNGNEVMWWTVKGVQELAHENVSLKSEVAELKSQINKIMEMIK